MSLDVLLPNNLTPLYHEVKLLILHNKTMLLTYQAKHFFCTTYNALLVLKFVTVIVTDERYF